MKIILGSRQAGKTTKIIETANSLKGYNVIVCANKMEARRLWEIIIDKKYDLPMPISFDEFLKGAYCERNISSFLIDNADWCLQSISKGVPISAISLTKGEE